MKIFAVTTFTVLLITAIFLTNIYESMEQKVSFIEEEVNDIFATKDPTQEQLIRETEKEKVGLSEPQDRIQQSIDEKHGIPPEFSILKNNEKVVEEVEQFLNSQTIEKPFVEKFDRLEATANNELVKLIGLALEDYKTKQENGEEISYFYFYQTYYPKVTALLDEINTSFNENYDALKNELKKSGFSPDSAEKFKEEFEEKKREQTKQLMTKVIEQF